MAGYAADGIRAWVAEPFRVPSEAMAPTLIPGDHFYVDKTAFSRRDPERGEIVVFTVARDASGEIHPRDERPEAPTERFVKRIVGVPGDVVEEVDGRLHVDGVPVPEGETGEAYRSERGERAAIFEQSLGMRRFRIARLGERPAFPFASTSVPEGRYFLMGDLRNASRDSRSFGTVAREDLIGPVTWIYWSVPPDGFSPRWERIGGVD